ncbi:unnamed protein product [Rhizophagus irregularis]|nr:unnamed protein product [Rhizophagus irregularis]
MSTRKSFKIDTKTTREWARKRFILEEITPGDYRIMAKRDNKPVLIVENMYEVLCRIHAEIDNHAASKPIIAKNYLSRVQSISFLQIDLIDLSYDADGNYKYICHVRDHFTRFSWVRPLTSKRAVEVAAFLFDLFFFIGSPPTILQSDNGKEFCAEIIKELVGLWPSIKIINGRSRHPQSQGLVERGNGILQQKLEKWKETSGRKDWSYRLHLVVLPINNSICRSHKKTPYELVYGDKPRENYSLVDELFARGIYDEENIPEMIKIADFESSDENLDNDFDFNENLLDSPASSHMVSQNQDKAVYFETRENETSEQPIPIDPVLIDITNEASS